jgi:hypothetical protein
MLVENECPFTFEMNSEAVIKGEKVVGLQLRIQNESDYLFDLQTQIISMSCCRDAQEIDIRARYKSRRHNGTAYLNPAKKCIRYVLSGRWECCYELAISCN